MGSGDFDRSQGARVDVEVVIETQNTYSKGSEHWRLLKAGVDVRLNGDPYLMHHKVMIIDEKIVVTGSYKWSWSTENRNDENLVILMFTSGKLVCTVAKSEREVYELKDILENLPR